MPLWSLSEEKVEELTRQMNSKKDDHDQLEATHINKLWDNDLSTFLEALTKHEELEERDRLAHRGIKNDGKKAVARKRVNKPAQKDDVEFAAPVKKAAKPKETTKASKKSSPISPAAKPQPELSLRERLALKANMDADKMPLNGNPLYDNSMGNGIKSKPGDVMSLLNKIGQKKRRDGDEDESDGYRPKDLVQQRSNAPLTNMAKAGPPPRSRARPKNMII